MNELCVLVNRNVAASGIDTMYGVSEKMYENIIEEIDE